MRMKIFLLAMMVTTSAFAHIKFGIYQGTDQMNEACQVRIVQKTYYLNKKHPLNERILIEMGSRNFFELTHPATVNIYDQKITVNHDSLSGQNGDENFSRTFFMIMTHEEGNDGLQKFTYNTYNYKNKKFETVQCFNLKYQE